MISSASAAPAISFSSNANANANVNSNSNSSCSSININIRRSRSQIYSNSPYCNWPSSLIRIKSCSRLLPVAAKANSPDKPTNATADADDDTNKEKKQQRRLDLEDVVNPVGLGRRSRQLFDEVWRKFSGLGQISSTSRADERDALDALLIREGPMCEFAIPGAQNTTVLVVGATSRIGRIVVRKLLLRGYTVKVLSMFLS